MINLNYLEDPRVLHIGVELRCATMIPAADIEDAISATRSFSSSRMERLDGIWRFSYYKDFDVATDYGTIDITTVPVDDSIPVPSSIQMYGYGINMYSNIHYPFPFDPPYVPKENAVSIYERDYSYNPDGRLRYIKFEAVDSCFFLYVNSEFVGYSQVTHSVSEFDLTDFLSPGNNTIRVVSFRWCDGSYFEDQDKLRMSGIIGSVWMVSRPVEHILDFRINTVMAESGWKLNLSVSTNGLPSVAYIVMGPDGKLIKKGNVDSSVTETFEEIKTWNAENPVLYTLVLSAHDEVIAQRFGFREVSIKDSVLLLNGRPIKFFGVNRHDSSPFSGSTISVEQARNDLMIMKRHNINAVRTSHYPNLPWFPALCAELGIYMIGESDIECHGCVTQYGSYGSDEVFSRLANDPFYSDTIMDRVKSNVLRDINQTAILIWSLGNESGYGLNFEQAGNWVKAEDPTRFLLYEGENHFDSNRENDFSMIDIKSHMYASPQTVQEYCENNPKKPFLQIEFVHAMGNGPGDIEENIAQVLRYPAYCGGFVWEWCDHSVYAGRTEDGRPKFLYGDDFPTWQSDGNFCMDGLVYPDRKPHTGLLEYKNCIRPLRAKYRGNGKFIFKSILAFTCITDYLSVAYEIRVDGASVEKGGVQLVFNSQGMADFELQGVEKYCGVVSVVFSYFLANDTAWADKGHILGFDELIIKEDVSDIHVEACGEINVSVNSRYITLVGKDFRFVVDKRSGLFSEITYHGREFLTAPMAWNIWRAPIDNDRKVRIEWERFGYNRIAVSTYGTIIDDSVFGVVKITTSFSIGAVYIKRILEGEVTLLVNGAGCILISYKLNRDTSMPFLPRMGVRLFIKKALNRLAYIGYGPDESYSDKKNLASYGVWHSLISSQYEPYVRPQENSSHFGTRRVRISDSESLIDIKCPQTLSFSYTEYSQEELTRKKHDWELEKDESNILCIDCGMSGTGSNACGPQLNPVYQINGEVLEHEFCMSFENA